MNEKVFVKAKVQCLSQVDRSKKGSIDEPVLHVVDALNASSHFFTTSSCSGRVAVFWQGEDDVGCGRRKEGKWLYISHDLVKPDDVITAVSSCPKSGDAWIKFEPMVLHVQCQSLLAGQQLLGVASQAGFRNSGLVIGKKQHVILAIRSTHAMDVPLVIDGQLRVNHEYLHLLCDLSNSKMTENVRRIDRLHQGILPLMTAMESQPLVDHATQGKKSRTRSRHGQRVTGGRHQLIDGAGGGEEDRAMSSSHCTACTDCVVPGTSPPAGSDAGGCPPPSPCGHNSACSCTSPPPENAMATQQDAAGLDCIFGDFVEQLQDVT